jgi:hypothetical protein
MSSAVVRLPFAFITLDESTILHFVLDEFSRGFAFERTARPRLRRARALRRRLIAFRLRNEFDRDRDRKTRTLCQQQARKSACYDKTCPRWFL